MDSNSDRPLKKLFFAYYLNKNFDKCNEIFNQIEEHDFREWLVYVDIKVKQNIDYLKENWFESGMEKFKDRDWKKEVSLFHLDNKEVKSNLEKLAQNLY